MIIWLKVGVLTTEKLDNGSGSARVNTFTTKQEFLTGKNTSNSMKYHVCMHNVIIN